MPNITQQGTSAATEPPPSPPPGQFHHCPASHGSVADTLRLSSERGRSVTQQISSAGKLWEPRCCCCWGVELW